MKKLTGIEVRSYRGLSDLKVDGFEDINVLIGPSNTGKSSLLEAIWLATIPPNFPHALQAILHARGVAGVASLNALFHNLDSGIPIEVKLRLVEDGEEEEGSLMLRRPPRGLDATLDATYAQSLAQQGWSSEAYRILEATTKTNKKPACTLQVAVRLTDLEMANPFLISGSDFSMIDATGFFLPAELNALSTFDEAYSGAFLSGTFPDLLEALKALYPNLEDIRPVMVEKGRWITYVRHSQGAIPMFVMGDGFKVAFVVLAYTMTGGLVLLDTPEAFQHPKGLEVLAKALAESVGRWGSQVILATQSLEFLDLLLQESAEKHVKLKIYRFGISDGRVVVYRPYNLEEAKESRELIGTDLRG